MQRTTGTEVAKGLEWFPGPVGSRQHISTKLPLPLTSFAPGGTARRAAPATS